MLLVSKEIKFDEDSVVAKLAFRTELEKSRLKWLRAFLYEKFPHLCFEQRGKKYDSVANALTLEGLVKTEGMIIEKDDTFFLEDASNWVTGWDVSPKQKTLDVLVNVSNLP